VRLLSSLVKAVYYLSLLVLFSALYTPKGTIEILSSLALLALRVNPRFTTIAKPRLVFYLILASLR